MELTMDSRIQLLCNYYNIFDIKKHYLNYNWLGEYVGNTGVDNV